MNPSVASLQDLYAVAQKELPQVYQQLETLCLYFPGRVTGSKSLEKAVDYLHSQGVQALTTRNCWKEEVKGVVRWVRYGNFGNICSEVKRATPNREDLKNVVEEKCFIRIHPSSDPEAPVPYPEYRQVRVLANGLSVGTPAEGISGEIVIVTSWEDLERKGEADLLVGKIVLYDYGIYTSYGDIAAFRFSGALRAAKYGALAVMVRTLTPNDSLSGPHTGVQDGQAPIPSVCIAIEECEMIHRLMDRGHKVESTLIIPCVTLPPVDSANVIFEIKGSEYPDEIVLIGGHIDSWDCQYGCCQGAHDDGQAVVISMEIIKLLHKAGLTPKRTIRAVAFTDEEVTQTGANQYQQRHQSESAKVVVAIETDSGIGPVCGYNYQTNASTIHQLEEILSPLAPFTAGKVMQYQDTYVGVDISPMVVKDGVPGLLVKHTDDWVREGYFHFHHSPSDSIDHINREQLLENFFFLLGTVWLIANSEGQIRY